eukprot:tig00000655_g2892.t1
MVSARTRAGILSLRKDLYAVSLKPRRPDPAPAPPPAEQRQQPRAGAGGRWLAARGGIRRSPAGPKARPRSLKTRRGAGAAATAPPGRGEAGKKGGRRAGGGGGGGGLGKRAAKLELKPQKSASRRGARR